MLDRLFRFTMRDTIMKIAALLLLPVDVYHCVANVAWKTGSRFCRSYRRGHTQLMMKKAYHPLVD